MDFVYHLQSDVPLYSLYSGSEVDHGKLIEHFLSYFQFFVAHQIQLELGAERVLLVTDLDLALVVHLSDYHLQVV